LGRILNERQRISLLRGHISELDVFLGVGSSINLVNALGVWVNLLTGGGTSSLFGRIPLAV
jgi:hypothetical protein